MALIRCAHIRSKVENTKHTDNTLEALLIYADCALHAVRLKVGPDSAILSEEAAKEAANEPK